MHGRGSSVKVAVLMAISIALGVALVFSGLEGVLSQIDRDTTGALIYYLIAAFSFIGILWSYTRSKQLIRAMPADDY